jgi:hypothetical protein
MHFQKTKHFEFLYQKWKKNWTVRRRGVTRRDEQAARYNVRVGLEWIWMLLYMVSLKFGSMFERSYPGYSTIWLTILQNRILNHFWTILRFLKSYWNMGIWFEIWFSKCPWKSNLKSFKIIFSHSHKTLKKTASKQIKYQEKSIQFFEKVLNIFGIIIQVDKRTKNIRIICYFVKRFDLISIFLDIRLFQNSTNI